MKVDSFKGTPDLEQQKDFLRNLLQSKPSQFKELAIMLKDYSKRSVSLNKVYDKLSSKFQFLFFQDSQAFPSLKLANWILL